MLTLSERRELFQLYDLGRSKEDVVLALLLSRGYGYSFITFWDEAIQKCKTEIEAVPEFTRWHVQKWESKS